MFYNILIIFFYVFRHRSEERQMKDEIKFNKSKKKRLSIFRKSLEDKMNQIYEEEEQQQQQQQEGYNKKNKKKHDKKDDSGEKNKKKRSRKKAKLGKF